MIQSLHNLQRYQRSLTVCSILQTRDLQSEMPELWTSPRTLVQGPMTCLFLCNRCSTCHTYIDLPGNANSTFNFGRNLTTKRWRQRGFGIPALVKIENLELELFLCLFHSSREASAGRGRISSNEDARRLALEANPQIRRMNSFDKWQRYWTSKQANPIPPASRRPLWSHSLALCE